MHVLLLLELLLLLGLLLRLLLPVRCHLLRLLHRCRRHVLLDWLHVLEVGAGVLHHVRLHLRWRILSHLCCRSRRHLLLRGLSRHGRIPGRRAWTPSSALRICRRHLRML